MTNLRNPFALRDGEIIMIEDVPPSERGLQCNCVCPACKGPFEARLGNIRVHHFAHNGEGCDEEIAFVNGLYILVQEYVKNSRIILPELIVYWGHKRTEYTSANFFDRIQFTPVPGYNNKVSALPPSKVEFETVDIIYNSKRPIALVVGLQSKKMAVCIRPPANCCKVFSVKPYKDLATLELNTEGISFSELKKE